MRALDLTNDELSKYSDIPLSRIETMINITGLASFNEILKLRPYIGDIVDHPRNVEMSG